MDTAYKTTLELDKVLNRAVQLCACQETKEMMQALEPAPTIEDERYDLTQTNAINALLIKNGSPRFGSVREVRRIVAHARKGGILSMGELLEIAATLRNFSGLSQWYGLSEHEMLPTDDLFFALAPQPVLEKQISESILSPEEMADTASVTLHDRSMLKLFSALAAAEFTSLRRGSQAAFGVYCRIASASSRGLLRMRSITIETLRGLMRA